MGRRDAEDHDLITGLYALSKKAPKLVRYSDYAAPADPNITVTSWKMNEYKYYDIPSPFPTLARGLFTRKVDGEYVIVARGYDKFFNIGEVPWNTWSSLEAHTGPPYTLTLKSNGCIIFIAALTPTKLLVTSKHSLGKVGNAPESHAEVGERWLRKYIAAKGKTEADLAAVLWEKKWTAVAELCDDSFEEHVLPYTPENTGLHLHGLNENTKRFQTAPPATVDAFAREWGLIETQSLALSSLAEVRAFTEEVGRTGQWRGEALEGFVVRTHVAAPSTNRDAPAHAGTTRPPYAPGAAYFFKVKFDEPYMMYRDWREVTKALLAGRGGADGGGLPKNKMKRPETRAYVKWVVGEIKRDRAQFDGYVNNKGIIAARERFLAYLASQQGKAELEGTEETVDGDVVNAHAKGKTFGKTIIVPVAIPGVGKTTLAIALAELFGFGHTQSDDVPGKKAGPVFVKNVMKLLNNHDVVIADKNNHLRQHRQALRDATAKMDPPVRLLALNWSFDQPRSTVHRICGDRIVARGDNHQTLRADRTHARSHEEVVWMFLNTAEELASAEVDAMVEMGVEDTPAQALARAVDACVRILGVARPSAERIEAALAHARGYAPAVKAAAVGKKAKAPAGPRYFGILAETDLEAALGARLASAAVPDAAKDFWRRLVQGDRVAKRPHITVVHRNNLPGEEELWKRCLGLQTLDAPPLFAFRLGHLVWNHRVMALTVDDLAVSADVADEGGEGAKFTVKLPVEVKHRLHITVGTKDGSISPVEAKSLVEGWRANTGEDGVGSFALDNLFVVGRLKGLNG